MTRKHLGHAIIDCMQDNPEAVCQIDAATGEQETNASVLCRAICLAKCFRKIGLKPGDVLSLSGRNHLDLYIPFYAALFTGLPISGVDPYFKYDEIRSLLTITRPKILFCQQDSCDNYTKAIEDIGLDVKIVTFDGQKNNFKQFMTSYSDDEASSEFEPSEFDISEVFAFLIPSSGTTGGKLKVAAFTHEIVLKKLELLRRCFSLCKDRKIILNIAPVQWVSGFIDAIIVPLLNKTKLQTSKPDDEDHIIEMINKYKPNSVLMGPSLAYTLLLRKDEVDLTCFEALTITGSKVYNDVKRQLQKLLRKDAQVLERYGLTEMLGLVAYPTKGTPFASCGVPVAPNVVKLMDPDTENEITEPYVTGELWVKGPGLSEYYNDPRATADALTEDGYYKTGDLFYRDENNQYYFVDRFKSLIKYKDSNVFPVELERVILSHPSVRAVCVCGVDHIQDLQHATACVKLEPNCRVTEQEIKDLVASKLSKKKQLHGGVVFVDEMPMTSSGKVAMGKVRQILHNSLRQRRFSYEYVI